MVTAPVGVGTRIRPPSTASESETGNSREMSSPSRVKRRSGRTSTSIRASPGPFAGAGCSLTSQTEDLPIDQAGRNRHLESTAIGQCQTLVRARDRLCKVNRQAVMQILPATVPARPFAAPQKLRESVVRIHEVGEAGIVRVGTSVIRRGKIPIETMLRPLRARRVDLASVETFALLGIAQQIVGAGNFLELVFGRLVTGVEIRAQFLRQLAICSVRIRGPFLRDDRLRRFGPRLLEVVSATEPGISSIERRGAP